MSALQLEGVVKKFGDVAAVDDLALDVSRGSIYGFLGQNGAGKTTTIRMIMSILYPDSGTIRVLGDARPEAMKDRLGYLPEEKGLYKKMKAVELITYFGRLKGIERAEARRRALDLLKKFGLGDRAESKCETLSKGMGQKVQILATLVHEPELVILDEPFSGLDPVNVELVRDVILDLKKQGRTVLFSTHVMEQAEQICDSIVLIHQGRKLLDGPLAQIKKRHAQGIVVDYEGDGTAFTRLRGVKRVNDGGQRAELVLEPGADDQEILAQLVGKVRIRRFDTREPSLHEIFVTSVGGRSDA